MKKILMIGTGGTIASEVTDSGLAPELTTEQLLDRLPAISDICDVDCVQLLNLDSTNMAPEHWLLLARCIRENYSRYDGFVVTHGTDTMAYTAAALSYLIQNSPKPIIFTGAQKPIGFDSTDSKINLTDAFRCAAEDLPGVSIVFNNKVILGTRARKMRSKSFNAFASIGFPEIALIRDRRVYPLLPKPLFPEAPDFCLTMNPNVFVLKLIPGIRADILGLLQNQYDAVILEGFGVGGVPYYANEDFASAVGRWVRAGKPLIMTTQVTYEGSDMAIYQVGHMIKEKYGVIEAYDMTLEAVVTKTMWLLGQSADCSAFRRRFHSPVQHDVLLPE